MHSLRALITTIFALLLAPCAAVAAAPSPAIFSTNFALAEQEVLPRAAPSQKIVKYVMEEMKKWNGYGVLLYPSDIEAARTSKSPLLCEYLMQADGVTPLQLLIGVSLSTNPLEPDQSCGGLKIAINALIDTELDMQAFGNTLVSIVNGAELATAGEAHRPADVGLQTLLINRVWSSTGTRILPWPGSTEAGSVSPADKAVEELSAALSNTENLDEVVWRFHHGYFRDQRENDPSLKNYGSDIADKLQRVAEELNITGDPAMIGQGEFVTPALTTVNVSLWARADDIGIQWTVPNHATRIGPILPGGNYPEYASIGDALAYPYSYKGTSNLDPNIIVSPLCSRTAGRLGYLCRPQEEQTKYCPNPESSNDITLTLCSVSTRQTEHGPDICPDITALFTDTDSLPLRDPQNPGALNPNLKPTDTATICDPQKRVLYDSTVLSHACYIAFCVAQSLNSHTLVTNRNSTLAGEMTSPYLSCMRPDPQLGISAEMGQALSIAVPPYIGHELVNTYEREYCTKAGAYSSGLAGLCVYQESRRASAPLDTLSRTALSLTNEAAGVMQDQNILQNQAMLIGERMAQEQAEPVITGLMQSFAGNIQQTANLLQELQNAPLTMTPCPWTGPFTHSSSRSSSQQ